MRTSTGSFGRGMLALGAALAGLALPVFSVFSVFGVALAGCEDEPPPEPTLDAGPGSDGSAPYDGGAEDAGDGGDAALPDAADAGVAPVILGITPSPRDDGDGDGEPTPGDLLQAELITFAAGVRGVAVTRALRDLDPGAPAELAQLGQRYAMHGKRVLFNLALVDGAADGRPAELAALPWDDPAAIDAVRAAVDVVLQSFGDELAYLTFGRDVDGYLATHPEDRAGFETLVLDACAYAGAHPGGAGALGVGVGFSFPGASAPDPSFAELTEAGTIVALSYLPGLPDGQAAPASEVAGALDAMAALARARPVILQAVGYPSAAEAESSEEKQRLFFATLFDALSPRRAAFPFVNVVELHDPAPAPCEAAVAAQGEDPTGSFAAFACSLGLFDQTGAARPAWSEVAAGAAAFAYP